MMHAFYSSTQQVEAEAGTSLISRSALSTEGFRTARATEKQTWDTLGEVAHAFSTNTRRQKKLVEICESEASLVYEMSFKTANRILNKMK